MHTGNGEWKELPIPKGADGSAVTYSYQGRCAILQPGEGYEIRDGSIVFESPPPEGAVIACGAKAGTLSSSEAVAQIVEGVGQMAALLEGARLFCSQNERRWNKMFYDKTDEYAEKINGERAKLAEDHARAVSEASDALRREVTDLIGEVREAASGAKDDREICGLTAEAMDRRIREANTDFGRALESCFAREGRYREECDKLEAVIRSATDGMIKAEADMRQRLEAYAEERQAEIDRAVAEAKETVDNLKALAGLINTRITAAISSRQASERRD